MGLIYEILGPLVAVIMTGLPSIVAAILVFFIGWVVARGIGNLVAKTVYKITHNKKVEGLAEVSDDYRVDQVVGKVVYYLAMIFVLVLVFDILGVTTVMEPFLTMTTQLTLAIPNLVKGGLILLAAWMVASVLRRIVRSFLSAQLVGNTLDRIGVIEGEDGRKNLVATASNLVYYMVLLMFLPAVLSALQIEGLRGPLENATTQIVGFLPNVMAALVTVVVGYFGARVVQGITTHFLATVGVDRLPDRIGMEQVFKTNPLSKMIGTIAFVLIIIPVAISALQSLGLEAITIPAIAMLTVVLAMLPNVAVALLLVGVAIPLARWVGGLVVTLLEGFNLPALLVKWGVVEEGQVQTPSIPTVIGRVVSGLIILLVLVEVLDILRLSVFSNMLRDLITYLPNVAVAVVILTAGWAVGQFASRSLAGLLRNTPYPDWLATVAKVAVLAVASMMALEQLGVAQAIVVNAFTILLGSLGLAAALAVGLGSKDSVNRWLDNRTK